MTDDFGQRVSDLRRRRGMTQAELGSAVGVTGSFLSLVEKGSRRPGAKVIRALAAQLDTTVDYLMTGLGDVRTVELDLRFAEVALRSGDPATARGRFGAAYEQAVALGDTYAAEQYEALYGVARAEEALGNLDAAIAGFEHLLVARDLSSSVNQVTLRVWLCRTYIRVGDLDRAIDLGEAALVGIGPMDAADIVLSDEMIELASTLVAAYQQRGDLTRAQMLIDSVVVAAEASGSMRSRGAAYWNAAYVAEARGEMRAARQHAERALALYGEIGHTFACAALRGNAAAYAIRLPGADLEWADAQLRQSISEFAEVDASPADVAAMELELARCCLLAGHVTEAVEIGRAALQRVPSAPLERARVLAVLAAALLEAGYADEALSAYENAAEALEAYGAGRQAAQVWHELAAVLKVMGRDSDVIIALERTATALGVRAVPVRPVATKPA
jgi:transcriptional regulator with XRE-family HTH domain